MYQRRLFLLALIPALARVVNAADGKGKGKGRKDDDDGWTTNWVVRNQKGEFVNSGNYQVKKRNVFNPEGKLIGSIDVSGNKLVYTFDHPLAFVQGRGEVKEDAPGKWTGFYDPKDGERRRLEIRRIK